MSAQWNSYVSNRERVHSYIHLRQPCLQSQSYFMTGGLPPMSLSWQRAPWNSRPEFIFSQLNTCGHSPYTTSSLMRGWVCLSKSLLTIPSTFILGSKSRETHNHILLFQIWDFPFCRLLRLAWLQWRYSTLSPHEKPAYTVAFRAITSLVYCCRGLSMFWSNQIFQSSRYKYFYLDNPEDHNLNVHYHKNFSILWDMRFSWEWIRTLLSSWMWHHVVWYTRGTSIILLHYKALPSRLSKAVMLPY
jgi:hypothetical protein